MSDDYQANVKKKKKLDYGIKQSWQYMHLSHYITTAD